MKNFPKSLSEMKILVVDDNPVNLDILLLTLKERDYDISVATDGEMALKTAAKILPDLILLDIIMPGIDGFDTCVRLKEDPATKGIPIIFISAKDDPDDIVKGFESGGIDYITKPFNKSEVLARVDTQLQLQKRTQELRKAEAEIKLYSKKLERSNQDLEAFASIASHDLKAPLRKICMLGSRFAKKYEKISTDEGRDYLSRICGMAGQLEHLVDSILQFSMLDNTRRTLKQCELKQVIEDVVEGLDMQINESGGEVIVSDLPVIEGDSRLFYQLFQNIISNAIKYSREHVPPIVNVCSSYINETKQWRIEVSDNGIGINEDYFERIFKPFERLHGKSDYEGVGIGLATCKKIVDYLNGNILVRSELGRGTTFSVVLPEKQTEEI